MTGARGARRLSGFARRISRRTIGKAMIAIGVAGILVSVTAVIIGQGMIGQVRNSVDDSLVLTGEALTSVSDTIAVTQSIVETVRSGMTSVQTTMDAVEVSLQETSTAVADTGDFLGGSLPDAIDAVNATLPTIESIASSVDTALNALDRVPFGPDYNPVKPFDVAVADLSKAIDPLPEQLRALGADFTDLNRSTTNITQQVATLSTDIGRISAQLTDVSTLLERYATTAARARLLAVVSRSELTSSARSTRLLLVLLGVVFALGQIVPIWLGSILLTEGAGQTVVTRRPHGSDRDDDAESPPTGPGPLTGAPTTSPPLTT